ncbi:Cyclic di-GMP phosphodiesterase Gmr [compost metagenome]
MTFTSPIYMYAFWGIIIALLIGGALYIWKLRTDRVKLYELAYRDPVTGLLNRNGLEYFWSNYKKKENLALLSLDLDQFKEINDTYGHQAGDQLLREVSKHLKQVTNKNQLAYRIGGDEFLFIMKNFDANKVEILAGLILDNISRPYYIQGKDISVTGSIGISMSQGAKVDPTRMIKESDAAMYHAKRLGKNRYCVFSKDYKDEDEIKS